TRVAVGYLLRSTARSGDTYTVQTSDAHAWPEVNLAGYGWVPFEPTNFTVRPETRPLQPTTPPGAPDKPGDPKNQGRDELVDPNLTAGPGTGARILTGSIIGLAVLVGLVLLLLLAIRLAKFVRRRRHRSGSGAQRIVGAWRDSTDRLVER